MRGSGELIGGIGGVVAVIVGCPLKLAAKLHQSASGEGRLSWAGVSRRVHLAHR